jgi:DNA-binding transcriptional regulator YiaG
MSRSKIQAGNNQETVPPDVIREIRGLHRLTQEKFAARVGVTFPTVNRWEKGHAKPSPLALKQLETLLKELGDRGAKILETYFHSSGQVLSA